MRCGVIRVYVCCMTSIVFISHLSRDRFLEFFKFSILFASFLRPECVISWPCGFSRSLVVRQYYFGMPVSVNVE